MSRGTALITGASSGIGKALAETYARNGFDIVITARREPLLRELADTLESGHGIRVTCLPEDLSERDAPQRIHESLTELDIAVDVLVNNAGTAERSTYTARNWTAHDRRLHLMVINPARLIHLFLPGMLERRHGYVLHILSMSTYFGGSPYTTLYSPSKSFQHKLLESLAVEYAGSGVHFTGVVPGLVATDLMDAMGVKEAASKAPKFVVATPRAVADFAYSASMAGKVILTHGTFNRVACAALRHYPARYAHRLMDWDRGLLRFMGFAAINETPTLEQKGHSA